MRFTRRAIAASAAAALLSAAAACTSSPAKPAVTTKPASTSGTAASTPASTTPTTPNAGGVPRPDHVVVVVMENRAYGEVIGASSAPYINSLKAGGADFSHSYAVTHPSEPNYLALFSGSTQGLTDDSCPHTYSGDNLGHQLAGAGITFKGYSEGMPSVGYTGCQSGGYYRKHNPWVNFPNVPAADNVPYSQWPTDFTKLPAVSFVVPDICNDMHSCSISTGDTWLKTHIAAYAQWAKAHNSLLVLTFDEDDHSQSNQIPTIFYGQHVATGTFSEHVTHYSVLRTIESAYGLACVAKSCSASPITDVWKS